MDIFENMNIKPMLIGADSAPFDSPDYIYELKLDGERCIAYLDKDGTELRNKRNVRILTKVPELSGIHRQVNKRCILDGELFVMKDGKPDFFEIQRRSLMSNRVRIELASKQYPASFVAFDILYLEDRQLTDLPLMERKALLEQTVTENERLALSRYIEGQGIALYEFTKQQELEGIVAKRKDSRYYFGKNTKDWIKIKNLLDDDFVVCGYIYKERYMASLILGAYDQQNNLINCGHATIGVSNEAFKRILQVDRLNYPFFAEESPQAIWLKPELVCTVKYLARTKGGGLRHPVFKGLRTDKAPDECKI